MNNASIAQVCNKMLSLAKTITIPKIPKSLTVRLLIHGFSLPIKRTYVTSFNSEKLLSAIANLEAFGISLKRFPTMVLVGPQSSGKSSVIHGITGDYILPTDMKMATRKPTHIYHNSILNNQIHNRK
jgi:hypothetical protein